MKSNKTRKQHNPERLVNGRGYLLKYEPKIQAADADDEPMQDGEQEDEAPTAARVDRVEMLIFDVIGRDFWGDGISAKSVIASLEQHSGRDFLVRINSPGGDVFEGIAIHNALKRHNGKVDVVIDALAASAAAIIAMAGTTVSIVDNGTAMIHKAWTFAAGNADDLRKESGILDTIDDSLVQTFVNKTGQTSEKIRKMLADETWLNAKEALELGFVDAVLDASETRAAFDLSAFKNAPRSDRAELHEEAKKLSEVLVDASEFIDERRARLSLLQRRARLDELQAEE